MGKKARRAAELRTAATRRDLDPAVLAEASPRQPCPCGSEKRFRLCHGKDTARSAQALVQRPFEGLSFECDLIALREFVPAATAELTLTGEYANGVKKAVAATILPMALPAMRREDGTVLLGLRTRSNSGDVSRDLAHALLTVCEAEAGQQLDFTDLPGPGPRLQDVLDPKGELKVVVHERFDFWLAEDVQLDDHANAAMEEANSTIIPTARLASVDSSGSEGAAYWCQANERNHLRWVMPYPESQLLDALARLHAANQLAVGPDTRFVGSFRAHGLLVPVWDLPASTGVDEVEEPAAAFGQRLRQALSETAPLTTEERRARNGLLSRQITVR